MFGTKGFLRDDDSIDLKIFLSILHITRNDWIYIEIILRLDVLFGVISFTLKLVRVFKHFNNLGRRLIPLYLYNEFLATTDLYLKKLRRYKFIKIIKFNNKMKDSLPK